ncbi:unnamed protein product [Camellia sinensis]
MVKLIIKEIEREEAALREDFYSADRKFAEYYNVLNINNFGCKFPEYIGNLSRNLEYLNLDHNHIFGSIPPEIVNLVGLQSLNMQLNQFTVCKKRLPVQYPSSSSSNGGQIGATTGGNHLSLSMSNNQQRPFINPPQLFATDAASSGFPQQITTRPQNWLHQKNGFYSPMRPS